MLNDKQRRKKLKNFMNLVKDTPEDCFNKLMFKKYIELKGSTKLAIYLNNNGYRVKTQSKIGQRKYTTVDIYNFMVDEGNQTDIDSRIISAVKYIVSYVGHANWEQRLYYALNRIKE